MSMLKGAAVICQSGSPSAALNASACGAIKAALESEAITRVLGACGGIRGLLDDNLIDLSQEDPQALAEMKHNPAFAPDAESRQPKDPAADDSDYRRILEIFKKYDVRYFFYNGDNESMATCGKLSGFLMENGYECRVIGIPNALDNGLYGTDHCPGFASAAKQVAAIVAEACQDLDANGAGTIKIVECMGRQTGWLTAAAALSSLHGSSPDLIYMPEFTFDLRQFTRSVKEVYAQKGKCLVVVSAGVHAKDGSLISTRAGHGSGEPQTGALAEYLAQHIKKETGADVRSIGLDQAQICTADCAPKADIDESFALGKAAVEYAVAGYTAKMVGFQCTRRKGAYTCNIKSFNLSDVVNVAKPFPLPWINDDGNGIEPEFIDYCLPLIRE